MIWSLINGTSNVNTYATKSAMAIYSHHHIFWSIFLVATWNSDFFAVFLTPNSTRLKLVLANSTFWYVYAEHKLYVVLCSTPLVLLCTPPRERTLCLGHIDIALGVQRIWAVTLNALFKRPDRVCRIVTPLCSPILLDHCFFANVDAFGEILLTNLTV